MTYACINPCGDLMSVKDISDLSLKAKQESKIENKGKFKV